MLAIRNMGQSAPPTKVQTIPLLTEQMALCLKPDRTERRAAAVRKYPDGTAIAFFNPPFPPAWLFRLSDRSKAPWGLSDSPDRSCR